MGIRLSLARIRPRYEMVRNSPSRARSSAAVDTVSMVVPARCVVARLSEARPM